MQTASLESGVRDKAKELQKLTSSLLCAQVQGAVRVMAVKAFPRGGRTNIGGENIRTVMNEVEMVTNRLRIDEATKARVLDVWRPLAQKYAQAGGQPVTVSEFAYELWAACDRVALGGQIQ